MEREKDLILELDRQKYTQLMAKSLPVLRTSLGLSQSELAGIIGVTRQTLSAAESGARELSWGNFISLLYVFTQNAQSAPLLQTLGVSTPELMSLFRVTGLDELGNSGTAKISDKAGEAK